ncbi:MAG: FKBP-type peptidyl-prolyl cis-trans isomerase [Vicinamibacteria bacterium]
MLQLSILLALTVQTPTPKPPTPAANSKPAARVAAPASAGARKPAAGTNAAPRKASPALSALTMTDEQKAIYALGLMMQRSIGQFDLTPAELELCKRALTDGQAGKPALDLTEWGPKVQTLARDRAGRVVAREKSASVAYLAKAAAGAGAIKTDSGLVYTELVAGQGAAPSATDSVKVNYRGTLTNGTEFDSSYTRGEPAQFAVTGVIKCWTEGLQRMKVGGKARLVCPSDLAYGDRGNQGIPGGAALIFDVELLDVISASRPPEPFF